MKEHKRGKRRKSASESPSPDRDGHREGSKRDRRSASISSTERDHGERKDRERNRHGHHHSHRDKERERDLERERDRGRDRERDEDRHRDKGRRRPKDSDVESSRERRRDDDYSRVTVKQEPTDESRDRDRPSSSKWDEEDDEYRNRSTGRQDSFRSRGHSRMRGGRGGGRGRGGGHDGGPRKKPFFKREEEDTSGMEWGKRAENGDQKVMPPEEKDKPNFGLSGKLTEDTNKFNGVVIKYSEPPEARVPKRRWRLYPFKGDAPLPVLHIHRQSAFLLGRDRKVVDIPVDHPSCSKQHAALQYRLVQYTRDDGSTGKRIRPYIIDLESSNGTFVNNNKIEPKKYVELLERDVIKFGFSSREYVLLHEHSKDDDDNDEV